MKYKIKKNQIFKEKLDIPVEIYRKLYMNDLTPEDYRKYNLLGKINGDFLAFKYRQNINRIGLENTIKIMDWKFVNDIGYRLNDILNAMPKALENPDEYLYDAYAKQLIKGATYSSDITDEFKKKYPELFLDKKYDETLGFNYYHYCDFSYEEVFNNWEALKDVNISRITDKWDENYFKGNEELLKKRINKYYDYIKAHIDSYLSIEYIFKNFAKMDDIEKFIRHELKEKLSRNRDDLGEYFLKVSLKFLSPEIVFKNFESIDYSKFDIDLISSSKFPTSSFNDSHVCLFFDRYGFDNVVKMNDELSGALFKDNASFIKDIYENYLKYDHSREYRKEGDYSYTDFNDVLTKMLSTGRLNSDKYKDVLIKYCPDKILDEYVPEEFRKKYNDGHLDYSDLAEARKYLKGKNISRGFIDLSFFDQERNYHNFYALLSETFTHEEVFDLLDSYHKYIALIREVNINVIKKPETKEEIIISLNNAIAKRLNHGGKYSDDMPESFTKSNPSFFISKDAPEDLKTMFYDKRLEEYDFITNKDSLKFINSENILNGLKKRITSSNKEYVNLYSLILEFLTIEELLYITSSYNKNFIEALNNSEEYSLDIIKTKEAFISRLNFGLKIAIIDGCYYSENLPNKFQLENPQFFLPAETPSGIKDKFYRKKISFSDFANDPSIIEYFNNTDIACGVSRDYSWMISGSNHQRGNLKKLKIMTSHSKIDARNLKDVFINYMKEQFKVIEFADIDVAINILSKISYSNSSELKAFGSQVATQLLQTENPLESLDKIESMFLRNNIPVVGKIYSVFKILHPDFESFSFSDNSKVSPILKSKSKFGKEIIIFSDLLKASMGSNNRSMKDYLDNIEKGNDLFLQVNKGGKILSELDNNDKEVLEKFVAHLNTIYNNTKAMRRDNNARSLTGKLLSDIKELEGLFNVKDNEVNALPDRIIKMFCHFAGIDTFKDAKNYFINKIKTSDSKNRLASTKELTLNKGDYVKGINRIDYLSSILQNGSISREFLGASASSDLTPLDTDISKVLEEKDTMENTLKELSATNYGSPFLVLKDDERFLTTRTNKDNIDDKIKSKIISNQIEVFSTGFISPDHYGIRTGFASSEIDYIVTKNTDKRIGLEIAKNGFYIPVVDTNGKLIFSTKDYDNIRSKMNGSSYFGINAYKLSEALNSPNIDIISEKIIENDKTVAKKHEEINRAINRALRKLNLSLKTSIDGNLSEGNVELLDTGLTGRGTNIPGSGDFDYIMRLDSKLMMDPDELRNLKLELLKEFSKEDSGGVIRSGDFRLKDVLLDNLKTKVDIDITFIEKNDKLAYSTEMALQDRLNIIKKDNPEEYPLVISNILLAKLVLKKGEAYKPNRGEGKQGGLGGVGIENWVLQNGGSFEDAANEFIELSKNRNFDEFKEIYQIWDFGENHLASKNGKYPHDDFVANNMSAPGYDKMKKVLQNYLSKNAKFNQDLLKASEAKNSI